MQRCVKDGRKRKENSNYGRKNQDNKMMEFSRKTPKRIWKTEKCQEITDTKGKKRRFFFNAHLLKRKIVMINVLHKKMSVISHKQQEP